MEGLVSMCTVHPSARLRSWAWGRLDPHRAHARVLLTFGTGHCICAGHTVQQNQVPGTGSLQCRAAVSETPGHSLTWGAAELLMVLPPSQNHQGFISRTPQQWAQHPATLPIWIPRLPTGAA